MFQRSVYIDLGIVERAKFSSIIFWIFFYVILPFVVLVVELYYQ